MPFVETSAKSAANVTDVKLQLFFKKKIIINIQAFIITAMRIIEKIDQGHIDKTDSTLLQQIGIKINEEQTNIQLKAKEVVAEHPKKQQR